MSLGFNSWMLCLPEVIHKKVHGRFYDLYLLKRKPYHVFFSESMRANALKPSFLELFPQSYTLGLDILKNLAAREYTTSTERTYTLVARTILNFDALHTEISKLLWLEHQKPTELQMCLKLGEDSTLKLGQSGFIEAYINSLDLNTFKLPYQWPTLTETRRYLIDQVLELQDKNQSKQGCLLAMSDVPQNVASLPGANNETPLFCENEIKSILHKSILKRIASTAEQLAPKTQGMNLNELTQLFTGSAETDDSIECHLYPEMLNYKLVLDAVGPLPRPRSKFEASRAYEMLINLENE